MGVTRNISLSQDLDRLIRQLLEEGRYRTTSEIVRAALRLLEQQEAGRRVAAT